MKTSTLIGLAVVLTIIAALLLSLSNIAKQQRVISINSFAECKAAGYPIMESYPEQCATPDGRSFINPEQQVSNDGTPITANGCEVGGCSAQLCGEAGDDLVSNCEYRPEYACYGNHSSCERQANGKCGWTPNAALSACIASSTTVGAEVQ
jgi:hypothetical protein